MESAFKPKNQPAGADVLGAVPLPANDGFGEEPGEKDKGGDVGDTYFSPAGKNVHSQNAVTKRDLRMAEDEIARLQYLERQSGGSTQKFVDGFIKDGGNDAASLSSWSSVASDDPLDHKLEALAQLDAELEAGEKTREESFAHADAGGAGGVHQGYGIDARGEPLSSKAARTVGVTIQSYQERRKQ